MRRLEQADLSGEASQMQVGAGLATRTTPANENLVCSALWCICLSADKWPQHFRKVVTVEDVLESFFTSFLRTMLGSNCMTSSHMVLEMALELSVW